MDCTPRDGFELIGPFDSADETIDAAEKSTDYETW